MEQLAEVEYLSNSRDSLVRFRTSWTGQNYDPNWIIDILDWQQVGKLLIIF